METMEGKPAIKNSRVNFYVVLHLTRTAVGIQYDGKKLVKWTSTLKWAPTIPGTINYPVSIIRFDSGFCSRSFSIRNFTVQQAHRYLLICGSSITPSICKILNIYREEHSRSRRRQSPSNCRYNAQTIGTRTHSYFCCPEQCIRTGG